MPNFTYEALDLKGQRIQGTEEAEDQQQLVAKLVSRGLQPVSIKKVRGLRAFFEQPRQHLDQDSVLYFTGELADLLEAGVPLERALGIIADSADKESVKAVLTEIRQKIQAGQGLSEALASYPKSFSRLYVNMVRVGELGGVLPEVLRRLDEFMERSREVRKFIITSSIYPSILAAVGLISIVILVTFVVPKFAQIFEDLDQEMPLVTKIIVGISLFLQNWWWAIFITVLFCVIGAWSYLRTPEGKKWWDRTVLRLPLAGPMVRRIELGRLSRTLGTLIESGVPILKGISLSKEVVSNSLIKQAVDELYVGVRQGKSMSQLMKKTGVFPSLMVHLVAIGEETGAMGPMLLKVADDLEEKVRHDTKVFLSLVEPVTIVFMGILIGGIILSMLMAIFGINDVGF